MSTPTPAEKTAYPASASGMYLVEISRAFALLGYVYLPGADRIVVDRDTLDAMTAAGVVTSVAAA